MYVVDISDKYVAIISNIYVAAISYKYVAVISENYVAVISNGRRPKKMPHSNFLPLLSQKKSDIDVHLYLFIIFLIFVFNGKARWDKHTHRSTGGYCDY